MALGAAIFLVPMAAVVYSVMTWEPSKVSRQQLARRAPSLQRRPAIQKPLQHPPSERLSELDLAIERTAPDKVKVTFQNASESRLRLVLPARPGGALTIVPPDHTSDRPRGLSYDPDRDGLVDLLPGDALSREYPIEPGLATARAIYDTRGEPLPYGAWSGLAESPLLR